MKRIVVLAAKISNSFKEFLSANYEVVDFFKGEFDAQNVIGVVTSNKLVIDKEFIEIYSNLKWIARLGSGMEIIDVEYANQKNIFCFSSPKGIANAVAEHAIAMLVSLQKNILKSNKEIQDGKWYREPNRGFEIEGSTIGIIGFGNTGSAFVDKLKAFDLNILVYDKYKTNIEGKGYTQVSLEEIYKCSNIVSYHLPLNTETENMYESNLFAKQHILINTSRGEICSTQNILKGFDENKIIGACLDVFDFEKNIDDAEAKNLLKKLSELNTILTPHIAGYSFNAIEKMCGELQLQIAQNF